MMNVFGHEQNKKDWKNTEVQKIFIKITCFGISQAS